MFTIKGSGTGQRTVQGRVISSDSVRHSSPTDSSCSITISSLVENNSVEESRFCEELQFKTRPSAPGEELRTAVTQSATEA
jgi:hypothetical protein